MAEDYVERTIRSVLAQTYSDLVVVIVDDGSPDQSIDVCRRFDDPRIKIIQQALALDLWLHPETGRTQGIGLFYQGKIRWIRAGAIILATGGGGQVFAQTTNPAISTGDGVAMAWKAGAILRDLEFMQFHPTALTKPGADRFLISEAVRGEGAHLIDNQGRRFAFDYHPSGELAPRDIVSRAIFTHLQKTEDDPSSANVWLDMRPIPSEKIRHRFPNIVKVCQRWGINVFSEPIPVAPAAHYWMGGIQTDLMNRTSIPGLYAVGETASTGVHGANRLASNSLLECIVFGAQMSRLKLEEDINFEVEHPSEEIFEINSFDYGEEFKYLQELRSEIPRLVWQSAGICREQSSLDKAISNIESWLQEFAELKLSKFITSLKPPKSVNFESNNAQKLLLLWVQVRNLLDIGYLILKSAAYRTESRGGHYRVDYPESRPEWQVHTLIENNCWQKQAVNRD